MTSIIFSVLGWVLPIVLAPLVYLVARQFLNVSVKVDDLPPTFKRIVVVVIAGVVVGLLNALGVTAPVECVEAANGRYEELTKCANALNAPTIVKTLTAALGAMFLHYLKKSKPYA